VDRPAEPHGSGIAQGGLAYPRFADQAGVERDVALVDHHPGRQQLGEQLFLPDPLQRQGDRGCQGQGDAVEGYPFHPETALRFLAPFLVSTSATAGDSPFTPDSNRRRNSPIRYPAWAASSAWRCRSRPVAVIHAVRARAGGCCATNLARAIAASHAVSSSKRSLLNHSTPPL